LRQQRPKPFGFSAFYPDPGLGGHCIPIDPHFITWRTKKMNIDTKLIELSAKINRKMPNYVFNELTKIPYKKSGTILVIGASYKKNIDDTRESPFIEFTKILSKNKIKFKFHDPYVENIKINQKTYMSEKLNSKLIKSFAITVIITDHDKINFNLIKKNSNFILDTRGRFKSDNFKIYNA
jgi:UDP-N-acetyl-D-mannosaminuronate dehydrogenase